MPLCHLLSLSCLSAIDEVRLFARVKRRRNFRERDKSKAARVARRSFPHHDLFFRGNVGVSTTSSLLTSCLFLLAPGGCRRNFLSGDDLPHHGRFQIDRNVRGACLCAVNERLLRSGVVCGLFRKRDRSLLTFIGAPAKTT